MPRRKRHRKNRRKNHKQQQKNVENLQDQNTKAISIQETPKKSNFDVFVTLPDNTSSSTSSLRKIASHNASKCRSSSVVDTTPMNTKRNNNEINGTNLSKLFNAEDEQEGCCNTCFNNVTPKRNRTIRRKIPLTTSYINNLSGSISMANILDHQKIRSQKIRSNSSISKLHSPGLDKIPIMVDVATQTVYFNNKKKRRKSLNDDRSDVYLQSCINIFETPKISQIEKLKREYNFNSHVLEKSNIKDNKLQNLKYFQNLNEALPNTYISPKIIQKEYKQSDSDAETSFFSPLLKISSTPIEKLHKTDQIIENLAKNILNAQLDRKQFIRGNESYFYNSSTPKTPNDKNIKSKVEDKVWTQKINKLNSCVSKRRIYNNVSPKKFKDVSGQLYNNSRNTSVITRVQSSKNDSNPFPKSFSPQRMSFGKSNNCLNMSNSNIYARFMTKVKKIHHKYSGNWLGGVRDVCRYLGITIRKRISSLCPATTSDDKEIVIDAHEMTVDNKICVNCKEYKEQITTLTKKVGTLDRELHEDEKKIANLNDEIGKIKDELSEFDGIKQKIQALEEKLEKALSQPIPSILTTRPPPPPPPIPPPPPLPPIPTSTTSLPSSLRNLRAAGKKSDKRNCENSRPVISLDDILNVKLKKTSDKPTVARRVTQPFISVEMLNQIKLRPMSRPQTPSSVKESSSPSSLSASPATSLTRILTTVDPNVRRLKRLRRVSRYSLDDSRKHLLKRERNGEDS